MASKLSLLAFAALATLALAQVPTPPPLPQPLDPFVLSAPIVTGPQFNTNTNSVQCNTGLTPCTLANNSQLCVDSKIFRCAGGIICPTELAGVCNIRGQPTCFDTTKLLCTSSGELVVLTTDPAVTSGLAPETNNINTLATGNVGVVPTTVTSGNTIASTVPGSASQILDQPLPIGTTQPGFAGGLNNNLNLNTQPVSITNNVGTVGVPNLTQPTANFPVPPTISNVVGTPATFIPTNQPTQQPPANIGNVGGFVTTTRPLGQ